MTNPLDAEADQLFRDSCKPGLSIRDTAQIAIRTALEMRDAERAEVERLRTALEAIRTHDIPRVVAFPYTNDGRPHKGDKCPHGLYTWEDCDGCVSDFAASVLSAAQAQEND